MVYSTVTQRALSDDTSPYMPRRRFRGLLYGLLLGAIGFSLYILAVVLAGFHLFFLGSYLGPWLQRTIWYSGVAVFLGIFLCAVDLFVLLPRYARRTHVPFDRPTNEYLTVVLTAYNDEESIPLAVADFRSHPRVRRVIVIDNNSGDRTAEEARRAGAEVVLETKQGYGHAVFRALSEALRFGDTELTLLCEGDMTFRAYDIDKFLSYLPHAEIVNGTRIVEQLRDSETQLTTFMYYGNFFVGKLLEAKHVGQGTFTDVGTTYKLCRNDVLRRLLPALDPRINLEFNAYFLDIVLACSIRVVECPVTFHRRVGRSKGGNTNDWRALKVGLRMLIGLLVSWRLARGRS
jgi:hypothetical protein